MSLEFQSANDYSGEFLNVLFPTAGTIVNSVFRIRDETQKLLNDPNQLTTINFEQGMSLSSLATTYLGGCFGADAIASLNGLDPTKEILNGTSIKIPSIAQLTTIAEKLIAPEANQIIDSVSGSILDLTGLNRATSPFAKNLKDCVEKVIDFKL